METEAMNASWRKSSYSSGNGGQCVEVAESWRKSSYSSANGGECVEAGHVPGVILVRDTTNRDGGTLRFTAAAWTGLVADVRAGKLDTL